METPAKPADTLDALRTASRELLSWRLAAHGRYLTRQADEVIKRMRRKQRRPRHRR